MVTVTEDDHHAWKPEAMKARLRAIQDPKGKSRGRLSGRYRSPDKTTHTNKTPPRAGFFIALEPLRYRLSRGLRPIMQRILIHSPDPHQNLPGSAPKLCSGVHHKGCDLEGVEGATPPTLHSLKPRLLLTTQTKSPQQFSALGSLVPQPVL